MFCKYFYIIISWKWIFVLLLVMNGKFSKYIFKSWYVYIMGIFNYMLYINDNCNCGILLCYSYLGIC